MRLTVRIAVTAALGFALATPAVAHARPLPSETVMKGALLTSAEMVKASGYSGTITPAGDPSCYATDDGGRDCMLAAAPADWDNPADYPYGNYISGLPTTAAATKFWKDHVLKPVPYSGESITIVAKTTKSITWYAVPSDPTQMAWSFTALKGKQGIVSANCGANTTNPDFTSLTDCSKKVAAALLTKAKKLRPRVLA